MILESHCNHEYFINETDIPGDEDKKSSFVFYRIDGLNFLLSIFMDIDETSDKNYVLGAGNIIVALLIYDNEKFAVLI